MTLENAVVLCCKPHNINSCLLIICQGIILIFLHANTYIDLAPYNLLFWKKNFTSYKFDCNKTSIDSF